MPSMNAAALLKRSQQAWVDKKVWDSMYDDAYSLALPQRQTSRGTQGTIKNATVYDSTLQRSTVKLAGTLQSTITPPFYQMG